MSINHPAELDANLIMTMFQSDLLDETLPQDCYERFSGNVALPSGQEPATMPEAMYLKLDAQADNGARYVKVPMTKDFTEDPQLGSDADQRLHEEDHLTKSFQMEYTDVSHASSNQAFGVLARDKIPYKLFESRVPKMGRYFKQYFGKMRRQATYECQSENLLEAPHFNSAKLAKNWFVPNIDDEDQPAYDTVYSDFADKIGDALTTAGVGTDAAWSHVYEQRLEEWAFDHLTPLELPDGKQGFIHVLPSPQCRWLKHPTNTAVMGHNWRGVADFSQDEKFHYPDAIGMLGRIVIIEDQRYPTLTLGGSASGDNRVGGGWTLTFQYRGMGLADDGSSDPRDKTASARQMGALYGKGALCEWMPEGFHWEWDYEMYDKYFGSGVFLSIGIKAVEFDVSSGADATSLQVQGYVVTPFARPPRT